MAKTRRVKRGGGKGKLYSPKNKTIKSTAKPSAHITHKIKTARKSALKTLKTPGKKPEVTPDKYLEGIIKFLNKVESIKEPNKKKLYNEILKNINAAAKSAMKDITNETKNYDSNDVSQLKDDIETLIEEYKDSNENDKHFYEIKTYTLANAIMDSINKAKKELKKNELSKNNELLNLLGKMTLGKTKKNVNDDLASLFSGITLKKA